MGIRWLRRVTRQWTAVCGAAAGVAAGAAARALCLFLVTSDTDATPAPAPAKLELLPLLLCGSLAEGVGCGAGGGLGGGPLLSPMRYRRGPRAKPQTLERRRSPCDGSGPLNTQGGISRLIREVCSGVLCHLRRKDLECTTMAVSGLPFWASLVCSCDLLYGLVPASGAAPG